MSNYETLYSFSKLRGQLRIEDAVEECTGHTFTLSGRKLAPYARSEIIQCTGLPLDCLSAVLGEPRDKSTCDWSDPDAENVNIFVEKRHPLLEVYQSIYQKHPFEPDVQSELIGLVNAAYDKSISDSANIHKIDYDLVFLRDCKIFSRLQESDTVDVDEDSLPSYWFDPEEYRNTPLSDLKSLLAIEDHWYNANYIVTCEFPADAVFLKTSVEIQAPKSGGGVEYIYLQSLNRQGRMSETGRQKQRQPVVPSPEAQGFVHPPTGEAQPNEIEDRASSVPPVRIVNATDLGKRIEYVRYGIGCTIPDYADQFDDTETISPTVEDIGLFAARYNRLYGWTGAHAEDFEHAMQESSKFDAIYNIVQDGEKY